MPAGRKKKVEEEGATPDKQKNLGAPKTWCPERKEKALAGVKRRILSQTDGVGLQMIFARVAHSADGESKSVQSTSSSSKEDPAVAGEDMEVVDDSLSAEFLQGPSEGLAPDIPKGLLPPPGKKKRGRD